MAANAGSMGLFAVGDANPIVSGSAGRMLSILTENYASTPTIVNGNGTHGSNSHHDNRVRVGSIAVGGSFAINPVSADLAYLLPKIMGTAGSGTTYALSDSLLSFVIQKRTSATGDRVFTFPTNYVQQATFSGSHSSAISLAIDAVGLTEEAPGSTWPSLAIPTDTDMFVFSDTSLTINSVSYSAREFTVTVQNVLTPQALNSRTVTAWSKTDRIITVSVTIPEGDAVYTTFRDLALPMVITTSYNNQSLVFTFVAVRFTAVTPAISGRGNENYHTLTGQAFRTAGALELVTTCDAAP